MTESSEIHDMIQTFNLGASPELMASRILDILTAMNRRMDDLEADATRERLRSQRTANVASCAANGIQPD